MRLTEICKQVQGTRSGRSNRTLNEALKAYVSVTVPKTRDSCVRDKCGFSSSHRYRRLAMPCMPEYLKWLSPAPIVFFDFF